VAELGSYRTLAQVIMSLLQRRLLLVVLMSIVASGTAGAQAPWTVEISTTNPVPIGQCLAVQLDIRDPKTGDVPRNPTGNRVTITDFDMTITSADGKSVAPLWLDAYHLRACGCQKGSAGTSAVITATYPARALVQYARVAGVSFQTTGNFSLGKPDNKVDPPACITPSVTPTVATTALPVAPTTAPSKAAPTTVTLTPAPAPIPLQPKVPTVPIAAAPVAKTPPTTAPVATLPPSPIPTPESPLTIPPEILAAWARLGIPTSADSLYGQTIEALQRAVNAWLAANGGTSLIPLTDQSIVTKTTTSEPAPIPSQFPKVLLLPSSTETTSTGSTLDGTPISSGITRAAQGALPTGFRLASSVPIIASLVWDSMPNAVSYSLRRGVGTGTPVERVKLGPDAERVARDTIPDPRDTYLYSLLVTYADGSWNTSPSISFVSPPLKNPLGFTATHTGEGNVAFQWQAVAGASSYRLDGPGFPSTGLSVTDSTSVSQPEIPGGANSWKLTTLYSGNYADYTNPSIATAVVRVLPAHPPWLSKNNGAGSQAKVQIPREGAYTCTFVLDTGCIHETVIPNQLQNPNTFGSDWLGAREAPVFEATSRFGLFAWLDMDPIIKLWDNPLQFPNEAVYGNPNDLGVGRRSACFQRTRTSMLPGIYTVCYAAAHGIAPGQPGFNDPAVINLPGEGEDPQFLLSMVITKEPTGTVFLVFGAGKTLHDEFYGIPYDKYRLSNTVTLDTEGSKFVPHACLSCHGGTYDSTTRKVKDASFLPIDPNLQSFASEAAKSSQQENIRRINAIIAKSESAPAVVAYINGLYGNQVSLPGRAAVTDFVPSGWQEQAGFYKSVVRPYCATCHLAAPASWNFASWSNFKENSALIEVAVCKAHTMPHAELQFKGFWLKDTGPVYTPGLLATVLQLPGCK
jgi:hypothetical protein